MIRTVGKAIALLIVYGTALQLGLAVYSTYRYTNVTKIIVSKLSDLEEVFEVGCFERSGEKPGIPRGVLRRGLRSCLGDRAKMVCPN
jgi:hypothetical protein